MLDMGANGSAWRAGRAQPPRRADKGAGFRTARHEARGPHHFTAHPAMLSRRHLLCCGAAAGLFTSLATPARAGLLNTCQRGIPDALRPLVERTFDGLDPTRVQIAFVPKIRERDTIEGTAWVDTKSGTVLSTGFKLPKPPSAMDYVHVQMVFGASTPLGPSISKVEVEAAGGILFVRRHLRGSATLTNHVLVP